MSTKEVVKKVAKAKKPKTVAEPPKPEEASKEQKAKKVKLSKPRKPDVPMPSKAEILKEKERELKDCNALLADLQGELLGVKALDVPKIVELIEDQVEDAKDQTENLERSIAHLTGASDELRLVEKARDRLESERSALEIQLQKIRPVGFRTVVKFVEGVIDGIREEQEENEGVMEELRVTDR